MAPALLSFVCKGGRGGGGLVLTCPEPSPGGAPRKVAALPSPRSRSVRAAPFPGLPRGKFTRGPEGLEEKERSR